MMPLHRTRTTHNAGVASIHGMTPCPRRQRERRGSSVIHQNQKKNHPKSICKYIYPDRALVCCLLERKSFVITSYR
jgi:hypothetical protein